MIALTQWLPPDAAIWRATGQSWSTDNELAAATIEIIDSMRRMYYQAHVKKGTRLPDPVHIRRPWEKEKSSNARRGTTLGELIAMQKPRRQPKGGDQ